ncbi:MAG: caspase family protein [Candidatus Protistobacter heckmanni]|nr:caspase family protein [Candidatus Protistobacter heckmanni]
MLSRRQLIKTLTAAPSLLAGPLARAADPSRLALVIGNSAYVQAPLVNPVNDANAMGALFGQAGFIVDKRVNASQTDMLAAIDRFGEQVRRSETKLAVFYYAGHGAQLDWRNFLLPVDAVVGTPAQLRQRCVDLGALLGKFAGVKDKTFVIILDACRNDPFGGGYRPEQRGLSQFDAPVGSLLAYATSPGNVAADGSGSNGLYTENLVRELSNRNARIEDALKRVRLNVRFSSNGEQIPWETTSLEDDVFIFPDAQKKLSEAELEKLIEADLGAWAKVKTSRNVEDWASSYLRDFPNGRFAEIAQVRLNRLLAEREAAKTKISAPPPATAAAAAPATSTAAAPVQASTPTPAAASKPIAAAANLAAHVAAAPAAIPAVPAAASTAAAPGAPPATGPMIDIGPGKPVPQLMQLSQNPNSAGRYPLGRYYSVGDEFVLSVTDILTGVETSRNTLRVTRVDMDADRVEINNGANIWDTMGNVIRDPDSGESDAPRQFFPAELQVGKKWTGAWTQMHPRLGPLVISMENRIVGFETVRVPAGEFHAFALVAQGWDNKMNRYQQRYWVVPGLNAVVKREFLISNFRGSYGVSNRTELVSLKQGDIDRSCAAPGPALSRNLVIQSGCV